MVGFGLLYVDVEAGFATLEYVVPANGGTYVAPTRAVVVTPNEVKVTPGMTVAGIVDVEDAMVWVCAFSRGL